MRSKHADANQQKKRMNLIQLTFIVAVNMMGSGIIMLPTNMAQVGAISLLSWIVTALGSMAIAYGFAQAGLFNQRPGGMSAYAEDAYGKPGYFLVFFLYFLSLAIGNVAIGISAVGYLATFFPWLSSTPVVDLHRRNWSAVVDDGRELRRPKPHRAHRLDHGLGRHHPGRPAVDHRLVLVQPETFAAAWNPKGLQPAEGMGSSISLTLWAFLGMELAAQNSAAVENPKRDVPLACMFGTLGAAVIYILSTTVIQGIVPNAELAKSTGPFGLAYAKCSIRLSAPSSWRSRSSRAWARCSAGSSRSRRPESGGRGADVPGLLFQGKHLGAPVTGMIVLGVLQSLLALMTISPTLSEQFSALVNLAVVTNVLPYIIALSALVVMMKAAKRLRGQISTLTSAIAMVAMLYSTYALYASGKDAVMGGMLVTAIAFIIWGFIAPRFTAATPAVGEQARAA